MVKIQVETTRLRNFATPVLVLLWRDCTIAAHGLKTSVGVALGYNKEDEAAALLKIMLLVLWFLATGVHD